MRRLTPTTIGLIVAGLLILVLGILLVRERGSAQPKLADDQVQSRAAPGIQQRCASQRTYDRIKLELFRRAAEVRGSGRVPFDRLSSYSVVRMESPLLTNHDKELGTLRCSGRLSLDLPPGVSVVGGRRTLRADIDYVLQPAADGSGDVVILEGADAIIVPLATLARTGSKSQLPSLSLPAPSPGAELGAVEQRSDLQAPAVPTQKQASSTESERKTMPSAQATSNGRPSFNCRYARTRGETAVCNDGALAALDRQMAAQYYRGISAVDARQRQALTATRDRFLRYRDQCPSHACIAEAYRGRMREISDIVSDGRSP